jgi:hypothetical protein
MLHSVLHMHHIHYTAPHILHALHYTTCTWNIPLPKYSDTVLDQL